MIGATPPLQYMAPRIAIAAILGGCVGAGIAAWRVGGGHPSTSVPGTGSSATSTTRSTTLPGGGCVTSEEGGPPAAAAADTRVGALCEAIQFERTAGSTLGEREPIQYRAVVLSHFAPAVRSYAEDFIAADLKAVQPAAKHVAAGGQDAGGRVMVSSHVDSFSTGSAVIELWGFVLQASDQDIAEGIHPSPASPSVAWSTDTVGLDYTPSGWRISRVDAVDGPDPQIPQKPHLVYGVPPQLTWDAVQEGVG